MNSFGDQVGECWLQHGDVEHQVHSVEADWKLEGDQVGSRSCEDFIWSKEFVRKFLGRLCHKEELSLDECLASNLEFWSQTSSGISGGFVLTLRFGEVLPELLV